MSSSHPTDHDEMQDDEPVMLDPQEADEVIEDDGDIPMGSDDDEEAEEVIALQNDSSAHFDAHSDSIFCLTSHPLHPHIIATGAGDDTAYIFDSTPEPSPVLPRSYETNPQPRERASAAPVAKLTGHTDSVNAIAFTLPKGEYLATAGLDGKLMIWAPNAQGNWENVSSAQEVEEINWLAPNPSPSHPNTLALGASDGSVWVYSITPESHELVPVQAYYLHGESSTAGVWTPDGSLLASISEDSSLNVYDPFGEAEAQGIKAPQGGQALVALTGADERFLVDGGLYSIAVSPGGTLLAVGGAAGMIRIVGLPRLGAKGPGGKTTVGQMGTILASLQTQGDSIETLSFSSPPTTLLASGSVDGSIALFDVAHRYAMRRKIEGAHEEEAVIKLEFVKGAQSYMLTSCGNDGVVRRWDCRGGTAAAAKGLVGEWRGHRGGGEGGGVLGFVQNSETGRIVTAGDDGVALVYEAASR